MNNLKFAVVGFVVIGLSLSAGCSSNGRASESTKAVDTIDQTRKQLDKGKGEVDKALSALDELSTGKDLKRSYQNYTKAVSQVEASGERARKRWQDMSSRGQQYIERWQKEVEQTKNPDIREGLEQRRQRVRNNYQKVTDAAATTRDAYQPFLKDLVDIQKALSIDLTPAGVRAIQAAISKARTDGQLLNRRIDALNAELGTVMGEMTPSGKQTR